MWGGGRVITYPGVQKYRKMHSNTVDEYFVKSSIVLYMTTIMIKSSWDDAVLNMKLRSTALSQGYH